MKETFPPAMAAVAGQLFRKGDQLHPEARLRFADWLSHHLSAFGLAWPWKKWAFVLQQPPAASQRRTVSRTLRKLAALAFWRAHTPRRARPPPAPLLPPAARAGPHHAAAMSCPPFPSRPQGPRPRVHRRGVLAAPGGEARGRLSVR